MIPAIAKKRMQQVFKNDAINITQSDFLATHVPFRNISIVSRVNGVFSEQPMPENKVYQLLFDGSDFADKHQFIIVKGSSGAGKSHFIRWLYAKLVSIEDSQDKILLIRRSDNTLKGTIKQLLNIPEVKNLTNKDVYDRLVRANQTISEQKFKLEIYHKFIVEIDNDEKCPFQGKTTRKKLKALFSNSDFEERMFIAGGPIDRIYNKIVNSSTGNSQDTVAQFELSDFQVDTDYVEYLERHGADRNAIRMAEDLIPADGDDKCQEITDYMNTLIDNVVRSCAGIEEGDFQHIFEEIRRELKKQGKNLILLIEDITAFTGINKELLNTLITEHSGMNSEKNLCRLISVIGTTVDFYRQFQDNYRDRITTQITIPDGVLGSNNNALLEFVSKYLNAISIEEEVFQEWWNNGASDENFPVHTDEHSDVWGQYKLSEDKYLSLYPFTKSAILNLYKHIDKHPTPRYILHEIVEPAVNEIIFTPDRFPSFCKGKHNILSETVDNRIQNIVKTLSSSDEERIALRDKVIALVSFWGNQTLVGTKSSIGGINRQVFKELNLEAFANKIDGSSNVDLTIDTPDIDTYTLNAGDAIPVDKAKQKAKQEYDNFRKRVNDWYHDGKTLGGFREVRDAVCDFIYDSINWQQEGVPIATKNAVKDSSRTIIAFERQAQGLDKGIIILNVNQETYDLILCFGKWYYLGKKSWEFDGRNDAIYTATTWLYNQKNTIVKAVKGLDQNGYPQHIEYVVAIEMFRRILNGTYSSEKLKDMNVNTFFSPLEINKLNAITSGHVKEWLELLEIIYSGEFANKVNKYMLEYFKLVQGTAVSFNSGKYTLNNTLLKKVIDSLQSSRLECYSSHDSDEDSVSIKKEFWEKYVKIMNKINNLAEKEVSNAKSVYKTLVKYFGFEEDDEIEETDIRSLIADIKAFYEDATNANLNLSNPETKVNSVLKNAKSISAALEKLSDDYDRNSPLDIIMKFSSDPVAEVKILVDILTYAESDIETTTRNMKIEKERLTREGNYQSVTDPRFEENDSDFINLFSELGDICHG